MLGGMMLGAMLKGPKYGGYHGGYGYGGGYGGGWKGSVTLPVIFEESKLTSFLLSQFHLGFVSGWKGGFWK